MAHNLAINPKTKKEAYFGAIEPAWHGLGTTLNKVATASEAIEAGGLDFTVEKRRIFHGTGNKRILIPNKYATVRTDTEDCLGVVGEAYTVFQNSSIFSFFDELVSKDEAIYHTAGVLGKGERVWILAKMPDYIRVGKDDMIEKYVLLYNSHDGTSKLSGGFTPIRVVCQNTLNAAVQGLTNTFSFRHTVNAEERLREAHKALHVTNQFYNELEGIFGRMAQVKMNDAQFKEYIESLFVKRNTNLDAPVDEMETSLSDNYREQIMKFNFEGPGQDFKTCKGTVFGAYNAITGWIEHVKDFKGGADGKLRSIWFNGGKQIKNRAMDKALELIK